MLDEFTQRYQLHYRYQCSVCGYIGVLRKDHYEKGVGCGACNGKKVHPGFNDVATTRPDLVKFFKDKQDAKTITRSSAKMVMTKCPECGTEREYYMHALSKFGFRCQVCYGGHSFPNRLMSSLLHELNIDFISEKCFLWSNKYRYDFYIPNQSVIIEMHGEQHYSDKVGWSSLSDVQMRDADKRQLAYENGVLHYFEIPADVSTIEYIRRNIEKSGVLDILSATNSEINWVNVGVLALKGAPLRCCELWNDGVSDLHEIAEIVGVATCTVSAYLKEFASLGLCNYSASKQRMIGSEFAWIARRRKVVCENTGKVFDSIRDAASNLGVGERALQNCLAGRCKTCGRDADGNRLKWKYYYKE